MEIIFIVFLAIWNLALTGQKRGNARDIAWNERVNNHQAGEITRLKIRIKDLEQLK